MDRRSESLGCGGSFSIRPYLLPFPPSAIKISARGITSSTSLRIVIVSRVSRCVQRNCAPVAWHDYVMHRASIF
jgi:hypothetical protein